MATNNFLLFTPTDTGTNLLTNAEYLASSDRTNGNQPGVASSKLNNKAIRQASVIISQFAQALSDIKNVDILDNGVPATILAIMKNVLAPHHTVYQTLTSTGTFNQTLVFKISAVTVAPTVGATYTNNGVTYTVVETVAAAGTVLYARGSGLPLASGTLTKTGGTGDATLTFLCYSKPLYMIVKMVGGGGGGSGSGTADGTDPGNGTDTVFSTRTAGGGGGPTTRLTPGSGGLPSGTGFNLISAITGGYGGGGGAGPSTANGTQPQGGMGGATSLGAGGSQGSAGGGGLDGTGYGSGGGGGGCNSANSAQSGGGGGAGAEIEFQIVAPASTYSYTIGAGGIAGAAGASGRTGGAGMPGVVITSEYFQ